VLFVLAELITSLLTQHDRKCNLDASVFSYTLTFDADGDVSLILMKKPPRILVGDESVADVSMTKFD
jgi:hypothetical protein